MRVWGIEKRLENGRGGAKECWEDIREKARRRVAMKGWEKERKNFMEERGWELGEVEKSKDEGELKGENLCERNTRLQGRERWEKIRDCKCNE